MESEPTRFRLYREVPSNAHMTADDAGKWVQYADHRQRVDELEDAVKVLAKELVVYDRGYCSSRSHIDAEVLANPIAAAAVREAGR